MAIRLIAAYSKKLGLPHYSSHSFSASVEVELIDPGSIAAETARLYGVLQTSVDNEIRQVGYLPGAGDAARPAFFEPPGPPRRAFQGDANYPVNGQGRNGMVRPVNECGYTNGSPHRRQAAPVNGHASWQCSDKQRRLLTDLSRELRLSEEALDERALRLFQRPVRQLNKLCASGLITDLLGEAETLRQSQDSGQHATASTHPGGGA